MKSSALAIGIAAALTLGVGVTGKAFAETGQQQVSKIHQQNRDIRADRRHLQKEKKKLAHDRLQRARAPLTESRALEHGNAKPADKKNAKGQAGPPVLKADKPVVKTDKKDIRPDQQIPARDRANADIKQRTGNASGI